tara:strand:- start:557 stop:1855 length:1299 start_codon:yes stop_codon:yes gene_type:complete
MNKSQLKKLIKKTLNELQKEEILSERKWCSRRKLGKSCDGGDGRGNGTWTNTVNGCQCSYAGMTHDWMKAPPSDPTGANAKITAGGPCYCVHYQTQPDGSNICKKWSPPGCGDAPFKMRDLVRNIRESIKKIISEQDDSNIWQGGDIGCTTMLSATDPACAKCSDHFAAGSPPPYIGFGANNSGPNCECCDIEINTGTGDEPTIDCENNPTDDCWVCHGDPQSGGSCVQMSNISAMPAGWLNNVGIPQGFTFYNDEATCLAAGPECGPTQSPTIDLPCKDLIAQDPTAHAKCCKNDCKGKGLTPNHPCIPYCKCCTSPIKKDPKGNVTTKKAIKEMYKAFSKLKSLNEQSSGWQANFARRTEQPHGMPGITNCTFINNRINHWNNKLTTAGLNQTAVLNNKLDHIRTTPRYNCCTNQTCSPGTSWWQGQGVI